MARKKKGNPELNVVSFCDIVTVSMVALFMALVIVIDMAMRTPSLRPTPLAMATTNLPVYFEFRRNNLYAIDRAELMMILRTEAQAMRKQGGGGKDDLLQTAMTRDIGNDFYRFDNSFLMMGIVALIPRPGVDGITFESVQDSDEPLVQALRAVNTNTHYAVYLVRDDSFPMFRKVRDLSVRLGIKSGWEYIGRDEPLTFEGMFSKVRAD
jgi:hypothetical protein